MDDLTGDRKSFGKASFTQSAFALEETVPALLPLLLTIEGFRKVMCQDCCLHFSLYAFSLSVPCTVRPALYHKRLLPHSFSPGRPVRSLHLTTDIRHR
jgi:hypothetical protein